MPKSATRRKKPPQRRSVPPAARVARPPLPAGSEFADRATDLREDDIDDAPEVEAEESEPLPEPSAGRVRGITARRAQVPFLLHDVIKAHHAVAVAERDLGKRVGRARAAGASWEDIGLATGMSRQGAAKHWG